MNEWCIYIAQENKYALCQEPFWQLTNDKRVASRLHNNKNNMKKKIAGRQIILVSEHKELYERHHPTRAHGLNCWKNHTVSFPV